MTASNVCPTAWQSCNAAFFNPCCMHLQHTSWCTVWPICGKNALSSQSKEQTGHLSTLWQSNELDMCADL